MKKTPLWIFLATLAATTLACNILASTPMLTPVPRDKIIPPDATVTSRPSYDTEFPLPDDVSKFFKLGGSIVTFQTRMSLEDVMEFYRSSFDKEGYTENELLTVTSDTKFNIAFDGHQSGLVIYVQGVEVGDGNTNVSIRLGPKE